MPAAACAPIIPTVVIPENSGDETSIKRPRRMMLLIVDDNAAIRRLIRRLVGDLVERVEECADGAEALAAYEQHHFGAADWVLMDVEMPGMDGLTATRQLKNLHPEARVLIVTKHNDESLRDAALGHGASGFVLKENLLELRSLLDPQPLETRSLTLERKLQ
jgi:CheY-like chemotaxis protein